MAAKTLLTLEQFEQLPDDGMRHELDEGELVSMPPAITIHGITQSKVSRVLGNFVEAQSLGFVAVETGVRLSDSIRAFQVLSLEYSSTKALTRLQENRHFLTACPEN